MAIYGGAWRVLDFVNWAGDLRVREHHLVLTPKGVDASSGANVPIADVGTVLIGPDVLISAGAMCAFASHEVLVLWCDFRGQPYSASHCWSQHTRVTTRQRAQAALPEHRKRSAWTRIVVSKIGAQAQALEILGRAGAPRVRHLASSRVRSGDSGNLEGQAAALYFPALVGRPDFTRGDYRRFPLNAALDYGYGVMRARIIRSVLSVGLHPPLALFHRGRSNYFALADDLIEPFRPLVDVTVVRAVQEGLELAPNAPLPASIRHRLVELLSAPFSEGGCTTATTMDRFASSLAAYVEREVKELTVPHWQCAGHA